MGSETSKQSKRAGIVRRALERGERDAQLLDGRDFDANYWRNARRQLTTIERDLHIEKRLNEALRACIVESNQDSRDDG
jgi:hypothetical protein